jgi:hypothetical protein
MQYRYPSWIKLLLSISIALLALSCVQSTLSEAPPCIEANNCFIVDMSLDAKMTQKPDGNIEDLAMEEDSEITTADLMLDDMVMINADMDMVIDLPDMPQEQMDQGLDQFQALPTEVVLSMTQFVKGEYLSLVKANIDVMQHQQMPIQSNEYLYTLVFFDQNQQAIGEYPLNLIPAFQNQQVFQLSIDLQLDERVNIWQDAIYVKIKVLEQNQMIFESEAIIATPPMIINSGELCIPNDITQVCPTLSPCIEQGNTQIYRCTSSNTPYLLQAWAEKIALNQQVSISARGIDNDANCCARMLVELLDQNGNPLVLNASQSTRVAYTLDQNALQSDGQGRLSFVVGRLVQNLPMDTWNQMVNMRISLKDILQNESNLLIVPIQESRTLDMGQACFGNYWGSCMAGSICQKSTFTCGVGSAPSITTGRAIKGSVQWKLMLDYQDLDLNASQVEIQALDTNDQVIDMIDHQWMIPVIQDNLQVNQSVALLFNPPADASAVRSLLVKVKDQLNLISESRIIGLETPLTVAENEVCDAAGFISVCEASTTCYAPAYDQPAQPTCLSGLPVLNSAQVVLDTDRTRLPLVENNRLSFQFEFETPIDELTVFRFELERNGVTLLSNGLPYQDAILNQPVSFNQRLNYYINFGNAPVPDGVDFVKVAFKNRFGFWTQSKRIAVFPVNLLAEGEICDEHAVVSICQPDLDLQCINQACQFHTPAMILANQSIVTYSSNALRFTLNVQNGSLPLVPKVCFALFDAQQQAIAATSSVNSFKVCSNVSANILASGSLDPMQQANLYFAINSATCIGCPNARSVDVWVEDSMAIVSQAIRFMIQ